MKTLLDKAREAAPELEKREKNIKQLTEKRDEAKILHSLIRGNTFEAQQQRLTVGAEIRRLDSFIDSEQEAIRVINTPNASQLKRVFGH